MRIRASASVLSMAMSLIATGTVQAQTIDEFGEIVVTAQRRAEASRDVPISVTSLSSDQLETANVVQLSDTAKVTPGLRFDYSGAAMQPTIRGVGTAITTSGGGPNVGIYVDGFFVPHTYGSDFQMMNVESIQVLKGPQGTLFGRNTTGGAILVTTAEPSTTRGSEFRLNYGRYNALRAQGYATFGLAENVAMDLEALYGYGHGFQKDTSGIGGNIGEYRNWTVRTGLKVDLSDKVSVLLRYSHSEMNDPTALLVNSYVDQSGESGFFRHLTSAGQAYYGKSSSAGQPLVNLNAIAANLYETEPGRIALNQPISFRSKTDTLQGTIKADLGFADLISYTQYRHDRMPHFEDLDATALPIFTINLPVTGKAFSQEFVLTSKSGSRLQWTAGLNYFQMRDTWDVNAIFGAGPVLDYGGSSTFTKSYAAFADLTYEFTDKLFVTLGARYSKDDVTKAWFKTNFTTTQYEGPDGQIIPNIFPPETKISVPNLKNDSLTPRIVVRYKPDNNSSVYASYTRGYKAGILNVGGLSQKPVAPEKIGAYEIGYKYDDREFAIDLAGYYYDYKNLQVSSFQNGAAQIRNAASSEIYGLEGQVRWKVTPDFNVSAGASWTHARYKSFANAPFYTYCDPTVAATDPLTCGLSGPGALTQITTDASGMKMQRTPDFTLNLGANYGFDFAKGRMTLSGNLYYTDDFYFDPAQQFRQKGYEVLALRAEWLDPSEHFSIAVYGDNVTNKRYRTQVLYNTLGIGNVWNSPTTYGVQLGMKF